MDPPRFINHYRGIFKWLRSCGLPTPWLVKRNNAFRILFIAYDVFVAIMVLYILFCYFSTIMTTSLPFMDLCAFGISGSCYICGLSVTVYQLWFGAELKQLTDGMDAIVRSILASDLNGKEFLLEQYEKSAKIMAILTNCSLILSYSTPFFYCFSVPVMDWFAGAYRTHLPFPIVIFVDHELPVVYELLVLLPACSIAISTAKKSVNDCLFISFLKIQTDFLKYLSLSKGLLLKELVAGEDVHCQKKLLTWVKLHQEIHKNIEEMILLISPVIITYYVTVIVIVVCGAFVELKKDSDNAIQSLSVGTYALTTALYYFLLSNTADELTSEGEKLILVEYSLPWYEMNKSNAYMVKLVLTMCNKPIKVTAYKAPIFLLNRETFAGFTLTATSAFVTFCQMKDNFG